MGIKNLQNRYYNVLPNVKIYNNDLFKDKIL